MDCSDVLKQGTKQLGVGVDAAAFLESTLDEISSICSNEADPIAALVHDAGRFEGREALVQGRQRW